jgi:hypothetical protein
VRNRQVRIQRSQQKRSLLPPALRARTAGLLLCLLLPWSAGLPLAAEEPAPAAASPAAASDESSHLGSSFGQLLLADFKDTVEAPVHWQKQQWGLFSLSVLGVGAVALADGRIRDSERHDNNRIANDLARDFEPLGSTGTFGVLGAFYLGGLLGHDDRAQAVAEDGLISLVIAGGVFTTALKFVAGRARPRNTTRTYDFNPFRGGASFPSGHSTQAFAVASVVAYEYDSPWIKGAAYGSAALVAFARVHHQAHFASDVTAGALIGTAVGRTVASHNRKRRSRSHLVGVVPISGPHQETGLATLFSF